MHDAHHHDAHHHDAHHRDADRLTVAVVLGTRPEAIKLAPVIHEMRASAHLDPVVIGTGQHDELLRVALQSAGITLDHDLGLAPPDLGLNRLSGRILTNLDEVFGTTSVDAVLVQGDTTSAFTAALAAFHRNIPVVHLEAGLRTGDAFSPFPEEANRRMTSSIAALHLAPTTYARDNLLADSIADASIVVTGNTAVDALGTMALAQQDFDDPRLATLDDPTRRLVVLTTHRRESWGEPIERIAEAVRSIARRRRDVLIVIPCHPNPTVRRSLLPLAFLPNVVLTPPLAHPMFIRLLANADVALTDSGGVQEEAPSFGVPVLVLRDSTERVEGVASGDAVVVGTQPDVIVREVNRILDLPRRPRQIRLSDNPYGDGNAARRCVAAILDLLEVEQSEEVGSIA